MHSPKVIIETALRETNRRINLGAKFQIKNTQQEMLLTCRVCIHYVYFLLVCSLMAGDSIISEPTWF